MFLQDLVLAYSVLCGSSLDDNPFFATDVAHLDRRGEYPPTVGLDNSRWRKFRKAFQFVVFSPQPAAIEKSLRPRSLVASEASVVGFARTHLLLRRSPECRAHGSVLVLL